MNTHTLKHKGNILNPNRRKSNHIRQKLFYQYVKISKSFEEGLSGIGVVEVVLILVVIIGLVIIFKDQLTSIINSLFKNMKSDIKQI